MSSFILLIVIIMVSILACIAALWLLQNPRYAFTLLLIFLPLHTGVFQVIKVELHIPTMVSTLIQSWKEGLMLVLIVYIIICIVKTNKLKGTHLYILVLLGLFIITGIVGLYFSPNFSAGLYSFRGTFEPFIILVLTLLLPLDLDWVKKLIPKLLIIGGVVAAFAIFQSLILGYSYLWKYYAQDNVIPSSFVYSGGVIQRAMGTFASPNQLSLYLDFLIILFTNLLIRLPRIYFKYAAIVGLFLIALILTVSRSGWMAFIAGLGVSILIWRRKQKIILYISVLVIIGLLIGFTLGLDSFLINTFFGQEISANYHVNMFQENMNVILSHPLGVGLGSAGARAVRFFDVVNSGSYYPTESYLLQTGLELGIPGVTLLLMIMGSSGILIYKNIFRLKEKWSRAVAVTALSILVAALVHSILIPDLQDLALSSFLWFFIGMGLRLPSLEKRVQVTG
jgi:O-antigen ligase